MDAVAYIDPEVILFVNRNLIPLRLAAADPVLGPRYRVKWTPTLLILDSEGTEQYRTLGFYPQSDLIPSLLLGMGKACFNRPDRPAACGYFQGIMKEYPQHPLAPEALYLNGVSLYIESHDVTNLIGIYDRLAVDYPESPWLTRALPYRLLKNIK
jgi:hypothetical protein